MTNKDKLLERMAQMSAEELSKMIDSCALEDLNVLGGICLARYDENGDTLCPGESCAECIRQWLEAEVANDRV